MYYNILTGRFGIEKECRVKSNIRLKLLHVDVESHAVLTIKIK